MSGIGKQLRGTGIAKVGFKSKHEQSRDHLKDGGSANWIKGAIKKPGALRKSLGVKAGEKIPASKLAAATKKPGKLGRRARFAETLRGFKK